MSYSTSWYKYKDTPITDIIGTSYTIAASNTFKPYFPSGPNTSKTDDRLDIGYSGTNFIAKSIDHSNNEINQSIPIWCKTMKVLMYSGGGGGGYGGGGSFYNNQDYSGGGGGGGAGGERLFTNIVVGINTTYNITIGTGSDATSQSGSATITNTPTNILYNGQNYSTDYPSNGNNGVGPINTGTSFVGGTGGVGKTGNSGNDGTNGQGPLPTGDGYYNLRGQGGNGGTIINLSSVTQTYDNSTYGKGGIGGMGGKGTHLPNSGTPGQAGVAKVYFFP